MFRRPLAATVVALVLSASPALSQPPAKVGPITVASPGSSGFNPNKPPPGQFFNAGVPISGFIPGGSGFAPGNTISFGGPRGTPVPFGYGSLGGLRGLPYSPYGVYAYTPPIYGAYYAPYYLPFTTPIGGNDEPAPPLQGAGIGPVTSFKLTGMPAELTVEFPANAKVWLNGREVAGDPAKRRELASPVLTPGTDYSFDVKAEWTIDGQEYEYERTVKVPAGERSKITVLAGTPKK